MQSIVLGILPFGAFVIFYLCLTVIMSCFLTEFKTIRKRCSPSLSSPKHGWSKTWSCSAPSPFSAAALKARWQNHCPISFWPLAALGLLSMLYKHYIYFFHSIDSVSICPRKSFNQSQNLAQIPAESSGDGCNPGTQTTCQTDKRCFSCWRHRGWRPPRNWRARPLLRHPTSALWRLIPPDQTKTSLLGSTE